MDQHVVFLREGALAEVAEILDQRSASRLFFVVDEVAYEATGAALILEPQFAARSIVRFSDFEPNPKLHDVERGVEQFREANPDLVIALGGGTALDVGKLVGMLARHKEPARDLVTGKAPIEQSGPPLIAIPTTAGTGSEATRFAVSYVDGRKYSVAHPSLLPDYAIIDATLTHSLPSSMTAASGLDAFCQAIESIWSVGATAESLEYAIEAARLAIAHIENATCRPTAEARAGMSRASHLAGKAINISKTTVSHALSYAITEEHGFPHGMAVAMTLGPMLAYNAQLSAAECTDPRGVEDVCARIATIVELLGADSVADARRRVEDLIAALGCPSSLQQAGIGSDEEIQRIVSQVDANRLSNNPRRADSAALRAALKSDSKAS